MQLEFRKWTVTGVVMLGFLGLSLTAWNQHANDTHKSSNDTIPKRSKQIRSLDDALEDLDRHSVELDMKLKNLHIPEFDGEKMKADLEKAMKELDKAKFEFKDLPKFDGEKLKLQIEQSLKGLDAMKLDMKELQPVDGAKIRAEVEKALKEVDLSKLKMEMQESLSKVDFDKMKVELQKIKEMDLPKVQMELKELRPKIEASMEGARKSIEKAKVEIQEYKEFQNSLEKDGLIDKDNYSIQHVDGVFKINGKVQPAEVYNKYRSFLEKHKDFEMQKNKDGININNTKKD